MPSVISLQSTRYQNIISFVRYSLSTTLLFPPLACGMVSCWLLAISLKPVDNIGWKVWINALTISIAFAWDFVTCCCIFLFYFPLLTAVLFGITEHSFTNQFELNRLHIQQIEMHRMRRFCFPQTHSSHQLIIKFQQKNIKYRLNLLLKWKSRKK